MSTIEITALRSVPDGAKGLVRDIRVRWALEEAGLPYSVRPMDMRMDLRDERSAAYLAQNPFVEEGLRIHVPPRSGSVTLSGAVRRPGEYEIGATPSLRELLNLVGGLSETAATGDARLTRVGSGDRREAMSLDLRSALAPPADVQLRPGDALYVPATSTLQDVVEVRGAFNGTADSTKTTVAGKSTITYRPCCTAGSAAVAVFASSRSIFDSAVFQAASTRTITSGSASTTASHDSEVHESRTSATTFVSPAASMIIWGAPVPAPTNGWSSPDEYQSAVSPSSFGSMASRVARCSATRSAAASWTPKIAPASSNPANTPSNVSGSGR